VNFSDQIVLHKFLFFKPSPKYYACMLDISSREAQGPDHLFTNSLIRTFLPLVNVKRINMVKETQKDTM
jgi:hypothetical protein